MLNNIDKITVKKIIKTSVFVAIAIIVSFYFMFSIGNDRDRITKIINKKYSSYVDN